MPNKQHIVPIRKNMLPSNAANYPPGLLVTNLGPLGTTVHETGNENEWADAMNQAQYVHGSDAVARDVAYHGTVDGGKLNDAGFGVFVQILPLDRIGWHAADGCNDPATDFGCFRSVGIEGCVPRGYDKDQMRWNFAQVIARIYWGDPAFDWGSGRTRGKFSIDQLKQHIQVAQNFPPHDCPNHIRRDGAWPQLMDWVDENVELFRPNTEPPVDSNPEPGVPDGMTLSLLKRLYGSTIGPDGKTYRYNPDGPWSRRWLRRCTASIPKGQRWTAGLWPSIDSVIVIGESGKGKRVIQYSDGYVDDGSVVG